MKKLIITLAVFMVAACVAPVFAGEFSLNGSYRLSAISTDTGATGTDADESRFFRQRFRLPFSWKVNDNVSAFMRTDWAEQGGTVNSWGGGNDLGANGNAIQLDYAWVKISQPVFDLTVGAQEVWLGEGSLYDPDQEGFTLDLKFNPVTVTLAIGKISEDGSRNDSGDNDDSDTYAAQVKYATETFGIGVLYAEAIDREPGFDDVKKGFGLFGNATFGAVTIKAELDILSGDQSSTVEYEGTNLWADISYQASEALTLGIAGYYAKGNNSATKTQLTSVADSGWSFETFDYLGALAYEDGYDVFGTAAGDSAFDPAPDSGVQAIKGYASYKVTDAVTLHGVLGYATPEENVTLDNQTYVIGSMDYEWMPNVTVTLGAAYVAKDYSDNTNDDPIVQYIARFFVSF